MEHSAAQMLKHIVDLQRAWQQQAATLSDDEKRRLYRAFFLRRQQAIVEGRIYVPDRPPHLRNLTCGARTQAGNRCRMTALFGNGRCVWHGGASTGPRTAEGKARSLENLRLGRCKRREVTEPIK